MFGIERYDCVRLRMHRPRLIAILARILSQIQNSRPPVPIEILAQAKAKDPPTDAVPRFLEAFTSHRRVGTLIKESPTGKLVDEWNKLLSEAENKPEMADVTPAISAVMAVKDEEELVSIAPIFPSYSSNHTPQKAIKTAASLTSTLLAHHVAVKLETILDREAKISHEAFSGQIEARLGYGEGKDAKGPDMRVWSKGRGLNDVSIPDTAQTLLNVP